MTDKSCFFLKNSLVKFKKLVFLGFFIVLWVACATSRPLVSRGLKPDERKWFVVQNGYGISEALKKSFIDGYPEVGMKKDLIYQLYGAPDRTENSDSTWEYIDSRTQLITGFRFNGDAVSEIFGDPKGGLIPEAP